MASLASLRLARLPTSSRRLFSTSSPAFSNKNLKKHESGFHAQSSTTVLPGQPITTLFPHGADATKPDPSTIADAPLTATGALLQAVGEHPESSHPDLSDFLPRSLKKRSRNGGISDEDAKGLRAGEELYFKKGTKYTIYDPFMARRGVKRQTNLPPWMRGFSEEDRVRSEDIEVSVLDSDRDYKVERVTVPSLMGFLPVNPGTELGMAVALDKAEKELVRDYRDVPKYDPEFEMGRVRWAEARSKAADEVVRGEYKGVAKQQGMLGSLERVLGGNRSVSAESKARMVAKVNVVAAKLGVDAVPQLTAPKKGKRRVARLGRGTVRKAKAKAKADLEKKKAEGEKKKSVLVVKAQSLSQGRKK